MCATSHRVVSDGRSASELIENTIPSFRVVRVRSNGTDGAGGDQVEFLSKRKSEGAPSSTLASRFGQLIEFL
jgi:hypothetical protein